MKGVLSPESWVLGEPGKTWTPAQAPTPGTSLVPGALKTQDTRHKTLFPMSRLPESVVLKTAAIRGGRRTYVLARPMRIRLAPCAVRPAPGKNKPLFGQKRPLQEQAFPPAPQVASRMPQAGIKVSIEIPEGFETDFASIPRILWPLFPPDGPWLEASIVHDYCYREPVPFSRFFADALFRELMARYGVPRWRRVLFYYAVRLCGWLWWKK